MKYIVLEIQKNNDNTIATLISMHDTQNEAISKYHTVLGYAAVSNLPMHAAVMLDEEGHFIRNESFIHEQFEETE